MAAKEKKSIKSEKKIKESFLNSFDLDNYLPQKFQRLVLLLIVLLIFVIFYSPLYFGGKTFQSGDIVTSQTVMTYLSNHSGYYTLWNPNIFCGMPAYALATGYKWFTLIFV